MDDLISRQDAIDALGYVHPLDYNALAVRNRIKALPSAQPERKKGRWININDSEKYQCSECGVTMWFPKSLDITPDTYIFCPHCGAEMTEGKKK